MSPCARFISGFQSYSVALLRFSSEKLPPPGRPSNCPAPGSLFGQLYPVSVPSLSAPRRQQVRAERRGRFRSWQYPHAATSPSESARSTAWLRLPEEASAAAADLRAVFELWCAGQGNLTINLFRGENALQPHGLLSSSPGSVSKVRSRARRSQTRRASITFGRGIRPRPSRRTCGC